MERNRMNEEMRKAASNRVVRPSAAQMQASVAQDNEAVINNSSPSDVNARTAYRIDGQPVSKG